MNYVRLVGVLILILALSVAALLLVESPTANLIVSIITLASFAIFVGQEWRRSQRLSNERAERLRKGRDNA